MKQYLDIVKNILENGIDKAPYRAREGEQVENTTIGLPNQVFSHEMSDGFPLLTTKRMGLKTIAVELEGFIKGITSKKWYQERGCNIWNQWANPKKVQKRLDKLNTGDFIHDEYHQCNPEVRKAVQFLEDDLGPIYGYQWRHFDEHYESHHYTFFDENGSCKHANDFWDYHGANAKATELDGHVYGYDQLKNIVDQLSQNPNDRRMVCSAWNPNQISMMALPPCHYAWGVTVYGNQLHMKVDIRSWDFFLGGPYNIASYALLLLLLCKHSNLDAGNLTIVGMDTHLYNNQLEVAKEQITRQPFNLPLVTIPNNNGDKFDFWLWDHTQFELKNYKYYPSLKVDVIV